MTPVVIVGAGIAGLSAAYELTAHGTDCIILDAAEQIGGRACSQTLPSGMTVDLGGRWLHGKDNPLTALAQKFGLALKVDEAKDSWIFREGHREITRSGQWLENAVDPTTAAHVKKGQEKDRGITSLARDARGIGVLRAFGHMWNGIDPPLEPSAKEFLTDESTPGGPQLKGGMRQLVDRMADAIGRDKFRLNSKVAAITRVDTGVQLQTTQNDLFDARQVIVTVSTAVLKSKLITFTPPIGTAFAHYLEGLEMGHMNKFIFEIEPTFFKHKNIPIDLSIQLLDHEPPHYCHVRSAGLPLITLFISGHEAGLVEGFSAQEAVAYAVNILSPVDELRGFEQHLIGDPVITNWSGNPATRGAYCSCLPGVERRDPAEENGVIFCGDALSKHFPSSLAGAFLSGQQAARLVRGTKQRQEPRGIETI